MKPNLMLFSIANIMISSNGIYIYVVDIICCCCCPLTSRPTAPGAPKRSVRDEKCCHLIYHSISKYCVGCPTEADY